MQWLTRPKTIRLLWQGFIAVLVLVVLAELRIAPDAHFAVESCFLACAALIVIAKAIGLVLKRPDSYYDERD